MLHTWRAYGPRAGRASRSSDSARQPSTTLRLERLEDRCTPAITFQFDYSLDTSGFFNNPQARATLEQAGQILGSQLSDQLSAITPAGGAVAGPSPVGCGPGPPTR